MLQQPLKKGSIKCNKLLHLDRKLKLQVTVDLKTDCPNFTLNEK